MTDRIFLLGEDPDKNLLGVYGVQGHIAYRRTGMEMPGIGNGRIEMTPEAIRLLGGLEWDTVRVADDVENHILVEGPGFLFAQRRLETELFQPGNFWGADNFRETRIAELLPALEALAELQEQAGDKKAVRKAVLAIEPDGDGAKATVISDTASGEAQLAGYFPNLQTLYGADLCRALRAVDRGGAVQIGELTRAGTGVRIDAEDGSSVLISGMGKPSRKEESDVDR